MTKCLVFWKKVAEFKEKNDFEGFRKWCGYKSYEQARRDWNAVDTFAIIAQKLGKDLCEVIRSDNLTENSLRPIIFHRQYVGKDATTPDPVQEKAIEILLPKIRDGIPITERDAQRALAEAKGEPEEGEPENLVECVLCHGRFRSIDGTTVFVCADDHADLLSLWVRERGKAIG